MHVGQSPFVPASNVYDRRAQGRIRQPRPRALGLGRPPAGENQRRRGRPALVRRHDRVQSAGDVRQADQPRGHRRHRRGGAHGRGISRRVRLGRGGGPLAMYAKPTSRVGIVGIGGLGHMAVKFAAAYGCEVTAFTSSESKFDEARKFGAHRVVSSRDSDALKELAGVFDLMLVTVNVPLDWDALVTSLAPNGRLHVVGFVLEPIPLAVIPLIVGQRSLSGSPIGPPVGIGTMLEFAARHDITPQTEHYPMSRINEAFERLEAGKARYRIVLDVDF